MKTTEDWSQDRLYDDVVLLFPWHECMLGTNYDMVYALMPDAGRFLFVLVVWDFYMF